MSLMRRTMNRRKTITTKKCRFTLALVCIFVAGCAGIPARQAIKVDFGLPVGKIEENRFTGIRFPFTVSAPSNWKVSMEYPKFMEELGYETPGLEESQLFIYNASTQSNLQIDFTPAGRYSRFNQKSIESLTSSVAGGLKSDLQEEYGKDLQVEIGPTESIYLKGVPFAARKYETYNLNGVKREHGWIYAFSEPYQIFILYMILEREGVNDREDIKKILDSFEVFTRK